MSIGKMADMARRGREQRKAKGELKSADSAIGRIRRNLPTSQANTFQHRVLNPDATKPRSRSQGDAEMGDQRKVPTAGAETGMRGHDQGRGQSRVAKKAAAKAAAANESMQNSDVYFHLGQIFLEGRSKSNLEARKNRRPVGKSTYGPVTISTRKTPSGHTGPGSDGRKTQDMQLDADPTRPNKNAQAALKQRLKTNQNIRKADRARREYSTHVGIPNEVATGEGRQAEKRAKRIPRKQRGDGYERWRGDKQHLQPRSPWGRAHDGGDKLP
jgi:hypothetical protein